MTPYLLHIEDSEIDHELFSRAVKSFPIKWFKTALEGYTFLESLPEEDYPQIIVLDLNLPAENGIKLIERMKVHQKYSTIPIIVLSSIAETKEIFNCYQAGANAFLQKTLKSQDLIVKIQAMVDFWLSAASLPKHGDIK